MVLPSRLRWLAYWLAPLVLVAGVAVQRYNVVVHEQTPWAGGGFGMFSTVDVPGARATRAYVLTDRGPALIVDPPLPESERLLYTQPTQERLDRAAEWLAAWDWRVFGPDSYEVIAPYLPDFLQRYLQTAEAQRDLLGDDAAYPNRLAFVERRAPSRGAPLDAAVEGVRIEVWRPVFDRDTNELSWELLRAATAPSPSPPGR